MGMQLIETIEVGSGGAASIEFTAIPQDGVDLVLSLSIRASDTAGSVYVKFNNDTTMSNYTQINLNGTGSSVSSTTSGGGYFPNFLTGNSTQTPNTFGNLSLHISNYSSSSAKSLSFDSVTENNATAANQQIIASRWAGTSGITVLTVVNDGAGNFVQYSSASLYKITAD